MSELMDRVGRAKWFTKLDLKNGYNLVRVASGHEWKTAFKIRYRAFKFIVMPWGLTNAPAAFQQFINHVLQDFINKGVVVYIDDILIYSNTEEEHTELVTKVLEALMLARLCIELEKTAFHVQKVEFLEYVIGAEGVMMSEEAIKQIIDWEVPLNVKEV